MNGRFMITGLPRSRTAWWSVVATTSLSYCHHEPLPHTRSFDDLKRYFETWPHRPFAGISDSGIAPVLGRILEEIQPRTLIVMRDVFAVRESLEAYFGAGVSDRGTLWAELCNSRIILRKFAGHDLVKVVPFEALNDINVVRQCMAWLVPGPEIPFPDQLMDFNIQVKREKAVLDRKLPHNGWHRT